MFPTQSNTVRGHLRFPAGEDLTGKEGLLVLLADTGLVMLPAGNDDFCPYVLLGGDVEGALVDIQPLCPDQQARVRAKGAGSAGDVLVPADVGTPADIGKLRALPAVAGAYAQHGVADEDFVDGQLLLLRPAAKIVRVASDDTLTAAADLAATKAALLAILRAHGLVVPA